MAGKAYADVVVGLDLAMAPARLILTRACAVADPSGVAVVHVCEHLHHGRVEYATDAAFRSSEELDAAVQRQAEAFLQRAAEPFGVDRRAVLSGHPATVLQRQVRDAAGLIVVGTHGRHGWRTLLGSTANAVTHGTPCSVLAVRIPDGAADLPTPYRTILVAADLSPAAVTLLDHARRVAAGSGARVTLGHVHRGGTGKADNRAAALHLQRLAASHGLDADAVYLTRGRRASRIHELARELEADLVVVGTRGRQGLERLAGSMANAVLHGASCDTLSVRLPDPARS